LATAVQKWFWGPIPQNLTPSSFKLDWVHSLAQISPKIYLKNSIIHSTSLAKLSNYPKDGKIVDMVFITNGAN
jgi:hypothetical protein